MLRSGKDYAGAIVTFFCGTLYGLQNRLFPYGELSASVRATHGHRRKYPADISLEVIIQARKMAVKRIAGC
jgi:hypothetical protein